MCLSAFCSPRYGFKTKGSAPPVEPKQAWQWPSPRARRCIGHDYSSPEDQRAPATVQSTSPPLHPSQPQESMPPLAAATPFSALTFWVPRTASGVYEGQPLMIFMVQPSPVSLQPSGKPPPPPQVAVPCATCSPVVSAPWYPGQEVILPPVQPETHTPWWPESPYGEGKATSLEQQPQAPSLPSSTSLLDELLAAIGVLDQQAPSPGTAADAGAHPALPGAPSLLDELLPAMCILGSQGPSLGSSTVLSGDQRALPGSPSLLEEILASMTFQGMPWSSPGAAAEEEVVEAILEHPSVRTIMRPTSTCC